MQTTQHADSSRALSGLNVLQHSRHHLDTTGKSHLSSSAYTLSCPRPKACRNPPFFFGAAPLEEAACFVADLPCLTLAATPFEADLRAPSTLGVACCASACSKAQFFLCCIVSYLAIEYTAAHLQCIHNSSACNNSLCLDILLFFQKPIHRLVLYSTLCRRAGWHACHNTTYKHSMRHCSLHQAIADSCDRCNQQ